RREPRPGERPLAREHAAERKAAERLRLVGRLARNLADDDGNAAVRLALELQAVGAEFELAALPGIDRGVGRRAAVERKAERADRLQVQPAALGRNPNMLLLYREVRQMDRVLGRATDDQRVAGDLALADNLASDRGDVDRADDKAHGALPVVEHADDMRGQ